MCSSRDERSLSGETRPQVYNNRLPLFCLHSRHRFISLELFALAIENDYLCTYSALGELNNATL